MVGHTEVGANRSSGVMSDEILIQTFIEEFFHGNIALLSNPHLRTEPLFDSMQLLSSADGVIATAKLKSTPMEMIVRHGTALGELMHQLLLKQMFYPMLKAPAEGCYIYRFCEPPEGYFLQCATAKDLWRACWGRGFGVRSGIPMDLLVWRKGPPGSKETWYSLKGMDCDNGQLTIKLLGWTDAVMGTDLLVWARQISASQPSSTHQRMGSNGSQAEIRTDMRSHLPFRQ
jgi:hypothetical protein